MKVSCILVVGAGSAISQALIAEQFSLNAEMKIVAITRNTSELSPKSILCDRRVECLVCNYSESAIKNVTAKLEGEHYKFEQIFICNGTLHGDGYFPEKRLADFNQESFLTVLNTNTITPMLWLMQLSKFTEEEATITVFSARVGSITDNRLGGWYSYRASKAALNMLIKTAAIELTRRHKKWNFVLFHPGTTDTELSKPFQANVPKDKLFTPEFVAKRLVAILEDLPDNQAIHYLDWQGEKIDW